HRPDHVRRVPRAALRPAPAAQAHGARRPPRPEDRPGVLRLEHPAAVVIADPVGRGEALAALYFRLEPRLYAALDEGGVLPARPDAGGKARVRAEWACFALYACVRGLIAAGGFNRETAGAVDALHAAVTDAWLEQGSAPGARERVADRYSEY